MFSSLHRNHVQNYEITTRHQHNISYYLCKLAQLYQQAKRVNRFLSNNSMVKEDKICRCEGTEILFATLATNGT